MMPKGRNMFHGEKEERYLCKDAAGISCRVLMYIVYGAHGIRAFVYVVRGNLLLTSLQPIWHPCLPPSLPPLPCYDSPLHCQPCHWNPHQHI